MSGRREEERLRGLFAALREESAEPPPFPRMWRRAASGRRTVGPILRPALAAAAALAAVAVTVLLLRAAGPLGPAPPADPLEMARALSAWEAPLDFLLAGPEDEIYEAPRKRRFLLGELPELSGLPAAAAPSSLYAPNAQSSPNTPNTSVDPSDSSREETG